MAVRSISLMFLSGHGAFNGGKPVHTGRLGADALPLGFAVEIEAVLETA